MSGEKERDRTRGRKSGKKRMCKGGREIERARARKRRDRECKGKKRGREETFVRGR